MHVQLLRAAVRVRGADWHSMSSAHDALASSTLQLAGSDITQRCAVRQSSRGECIVRSYVGISWAQGWRGAQKRLHNILQCVKFCNCDPKPTVVNGHDHARVRGLIDIMREDRDAPTTYMHSSNASHSLQGFKASIHPSSCSVSLVRLVSSQFRCLFAWWLFISLTGRNRVFRPAAHIDRSPSGTSQHWHVHWIPLVHEQATRCCEGVVVVVYRT